CVFSVDSAGGHIYVDGTWQADQSWTGSASAPTTTEDIYFGYYPGGGDYLNGSIDEMRLSNVARSADWIATEYNNQNSPSTFYTLGEFSPLAITSPNSTAFT